MRATPIPRQQTDAEGRKLCRWCQAPVPKGRRTFCSEACVHEALLRAHPGYLRQQTHKRDKGICAACGTDTDAMKQEYNRLVAFASKGIFAFSRTTTKVVKATGVANDYALEFAMCRKTTAEAELEIAERTAERLAWHIRNAELRAANPTGRYATVEHPDSDTKWQRDMDKIRMEAKDMPPEILHARAIHRRLKRLAEARRKRLHAELRAAGWHGVEKRKASNMWQADHILPVQHGGGGCGLENIQSLCTLCHKRKTAEQARRNALVRRGIDPDAPPPQMTLAI